MSDLNRFVLFTYVAQISSITQAAIQLNLTKAALSKQIKKLEAELGVNLFVRTGQRLCLTEHGEILLQQSLRLKCELENTQTICQSFHKKPKGTLYIVALDFFAKKIIYPRLNQFMQTYPGLDITIDTSERIPDFKKENADLALGFSLDVSNADGVIQKSMAITRHVMCASPHYLQKHGIPTQLNDLLKHRYIGHQSRDEISSDHLIKNQSLKLKPNLILSNVNSMIECAKNGLGIVQLPYYLVATYLQLGELVEVLASYQATNANVYYFYPKFRHTQPKVRCFIDFFLKNYSESFG